MIRLAADALGWAAGGRFVLVDVDLALPAGSLTVLTGENGAGKSTLLDVLSGNRTPARGVVKLDGVPLAEIEPAHLARRIARLDHAYYVLDAPVASDADYDQLMRRDEWYGRERG